MKEGMEEKELRKKWDSLRTQYTRYRKLAPSGSCGAQRTGRQQWILTRLQFLEQKGRRVLRTSPSRGTSSETSTSTTEEPFHFDAEPCTPLAESTICTTPAPLREAKHTQNAKLYF
ncbi:hypothetical protein F7725_026947, partial [Dissostichus mawsoni]